MRTILALDLGTQMGWAVHCKGLVNSGSENFRGGRFEGGGMRFFRFRYWLDEIRGFCGGLDAIYFEEVRMHKGYDAAHVYGGFLGQLGVWGESNSVPYLGVPVGTIKKHVTGKGNASKKAVIDAVCGAGYKPVDDNEADALALLMYARSLYV